MLKLVQLHACHDLAKPFISALFVVLQFSGELSTNINQSFFTAKVKDLTSNFTWKVQYEEGFDSFKKFNLLQHQQCLLLQTVKQPILIDWAERMANFSGGLARSYFWVHTLFLPLSSNPLSFSQNVFFPHSLHSLSRLLSNHLWLKGECGQID